MKVGLYFGSFNPIHIGHLIIANHLITHSDLDQIWFVVSPHNPLKDKKSLLADYHRLALVKEAIDDNEKFRASDVEFNLEQPNYTVKTMLVLAEQYPKCTFSLIMGEDNLNSLTKWYNYDYLLEHYRIFVYPRIDFSTNNKVNELLQHPSIVFLKDVPTMNISSSFIRQEIANGGDVRYLLTPPVLKYIDDMGFYSK